ncbi:Glycosyltransferase involved in cell wall bisynthesis [Pseudobutyrivibrio sp. NOR37]|uniref:Glycosyltransferase family 4 protein n=1 Tax=Pseudobutyrivibrio xylanivorans TaxID=185007 RepID=A0A6M0LII0_PSEXY|nr:MULTISPECIES: glycosyltransferase family 1 protein [Pseudobutyrivibrio]NEX02292.1 glycosyltransferase family 4 protein [Pseudobutyrivibrio xylanivorans]SFR77818.1 Glycosyltransferase involved in cell wall bisynthesis [Pseudobutyrivibrio sp. NOR37]
MKLLIDARNLGSKPSGIGIYAYNWIKAFEENGSLEVHVIVDVIESAQIKELDLNGRVKVHCYGRTSNKSANIFQYFKYVKRLIEQVQPDIFWEVNNLAPIKIKNPYGKYIVTIHDMFPITMPECFGKIYPYYFKYGVAKTIKCVDAILYDSNYSKKETEKYFPLAKKKDSFISYIIIPPIPEMDVEEKDYFLYIGNLEKRKGTDILLDAYQLYVEQGGTRELILAGKIRENDIETRIKELDKKLPGFHYLGYIDDETRTRLYRECGCFVFPSRAEGFGMPIIEAMQCGKPVIASDLEIFEELVGQAIDMFEYRNDSNDSERLFQKMIEQDNLSDERDTKRVVNKYSADNLDKKLIDYLAEI